MMAMDMDTGSRWAMNVYDRYGFYVGDEHIAWDQNALKADY